MIKVINKKIKLISLYLFLICILCICNQMIINYAATSVVNKEVSSIQEGTELSSISVVLGRNSKHFLQDSELLADEITKQQLLKIEDINMTMWNISLLIRQLIKLLILMSEVILFTYFICKLLRFMIAYRFKQDGKKQIFYTGYYGIL